MELSPYRTAANNYDDYYDYNTQPESTANDYGGYYDYNTQPESTANDYGGYYDYNEEPDYRNWWSYRGESGRDRWLWSGSGSGTEWSGSGSGSGSGTGWWRWYEWRVDRLSDKVGDLEDELEVAAGAFAGMTLLFLLILAAEFVCLAATCYKLGRQRAERGISRAAKKYEAPPTMGVTVVNPNYGFGSHGTSDRVTLAPLPYKPGNDENVVDFNQRAQLMPSSTSSA